MILDLHQQGLSVTAIARRTGRDPKTVRKYIERGLEPPAYGPRQAGRPSKLAPYLVLPARARHGLPRSQRRAPDPRAAGARLYGGLHCREAVRRRDPSTRGQALRGSLRDPRRPAGTGRLRPLRGHLHRRTGRELHRLAVLSGARPFPAHRGALRPASGSADADALSHPGVRRARRRADRDPLRPHEDRGHRRGGRRPHRLQSIPTGASQTLRLLAACLPAVPGQDEGQGRTAVLVHPPGLLRCPLLPRPRRPEPPAPDLARHHRQRPPARHHAANRLGGLRRREARAAAAARRALRRPAQARTARQPRRPRLGRRQLLQRAGSDAAGGSKCTSCPTRSASSMAAGSWRATRSWRGGDNTASIPIIGREERPGPCGTVIPTARRSAVVAITSPSAAGRLPSHRRTARHGIGGRS